MMYRTNQSGFTIIELTLAMSFVAILLISVAMLSIQLTNQYSRGITLKEVAQAGTEVTNDMKRTMAQSQLSPQGVRTKDLAGGAKVLCVGNYSYVANSVANLEANNGAGNANTIKVGPAGHESIVRLAKVRDDAGELCSTNTLDVDKTYEESDVTELLGGGSRLLAVRKLSVSSSPAASDPFYKEFTQGRAIYTVRITIGAGLDSETEIVGADESRCRAPGDNQGNSDFCAINSFEFTTRIGSSRD